LYDSSVDQATIVPLKIRADIQGLALRIRSEFGGDENFFDTELGNEKRDKEGGGIGECEKKCR
jgi:hypothetical protein